MQFREPRTCREKQAINKHGPSLSATDLNRHDLLVHPQTLPSSHFDPTQRTSNIGTMASNTSQCPFGAPNRYVSTHTADGKAVFSTTLSETLTTYNIPGMAYHEAYTTLDAPINLNDETDIKTVKALEPEEKTISFPSPGQTILRYCDWPPEGTSPLHRHETMDYGIVIHGQMEAIMDSGETRLMKAGDVLVQRNTLHGWRNPSATEWARMVFVIQGCPPVKVGDKVMRQDLDAFGK